MLIQILCITLLFPALLVAIYYWFLVLCALSMKPKVRPKNDKDPFHTFAIVIPAHNEEQVISDLLVSCAKLDYPKEKYRVYVVADNCSDLTAKIAAREGAVCLERHDDKHRGKGFALAWAFERILPKGYDALLVLDADCSIGSHALLVFDRYLQEGNQVLQANDTVSNPDESTTSYALAVGNLIENDLFYAPKSHLGLAVFLRGTGMVFHRKVLQTYPWKAHSIVEDIEYTLSLFRRGIRVKFTNEVNVTSESPVHQDQLSIQRTRWASGNLRLSKKFPLKLMWEGLAKRQPLLLDAAWTLLVLSRPLVLLELFVAVMFAVLCFRLVPGSFSNGLLAIGFSLVFFQCLYAGVGIVLLGLSTRRTALLLSAPAVLFRLIGINLLATFGIGKNNWMRTPR